MKLNKSTIWAFVILILTASLYRIWSDRPYGFAPQMAMAIFGGAVISNKRMAFILPLVSLFLSDVLYEVLFRNGLTAIQGFYPGQWGIYLLFIGLTFFGMLMKKINVLSVLGFTVAGSVLFFLISNLLVWLAGDGFQRPLTFEGLMLCYGDALACYRQYAGTELMPLLGDLFFSGVLFGSHYLITKKVLRTADVQTA